MRNEKKANCAEWVIQTLKKNKFKYLYHHKTERYIDILQELVEGYNEGYHTGIKRAPSTVNRENEVHLWTEQHLLKSQSECKRSS